LATLCQSRDGREANAFGIAPHPVYFTRTAFSSGVAGRLSASKVFKT